MEPRRPLAEVVHRTLQRARLRFELSDADVGLLDEIARGLADLEYVTRVQASPRARSILVLYRGELDRVLEQAEARGLFGVRPQRGRAPMRQLRHGIEHVDAVMAEGTRDAVTLGNMTFLGLVAVGVFQAQRGQLLPAGITLFSYALRVMNWVADREGR